MAARSRSVVLKHGNCADQIFWRPQTMTATCRFTTAKSMTATDNDGHNKCQWRPHRRLRWRPRNVNDYHKVDFDGQSKTFTYSTSALRCALWAIVSDIASAALCSATNRYISLTIARNAQRSADVVETGLNTRANKSRQRDARGVGDIIM